MEEAVYVLGALVSLLCAVLLGNTWRATRTPLLLWCLLCFLGLALNNVILLVDKVVLPDDDLSLLRGIPAALGVAALVWGLVWETRE